EQDVHQAGHDPRVRLLALAGRQTSENRTDVQATVRADRATRVALAARCLAFDALVPPGAHTRVSRASRIGTARAMRCEPMVGSTLPHFWWMLPAIGPRNARAIAGDRSDAAVRCRRTLRTRGTGIAHLIHRRGGVAGIHTFRRPLREESRMNGG